MKVYKFGGASVNSVERIQNLKKILQAGPEEHLVVVISAIGKTTNALEKVATAFFQKNQTQALELFEEIKQHHLHIAKQLLVTHYLPCDKQLREFFTEIEWLLHDHPVRSFDYYYDQIVCVGELLSTTIISYYLNESGVKNEWVDVRDILKTNNQFREAVVDYEATEALLKAQLHQTHNKQISILLTQGFIGATADNESTTLGREGSDYTAAIFANLLNAESVTIWKDVEGVMNADPKSFQDATLIPLLSFTEAIEMTYYGAQVIHPKTIKPLQNKQIPLYVKCFLNPSLEGTVIKKAVLKNLPPIIVVKSNQALIQLKQLNFDFVGEATISHIYHLLAELNIQPNLIQTGAITLQLCVDDKEEKISALASSIAHEFDVVVQKQLSLLTIRHYNEAILNELTANKKILLMQRTTETVQVLYAEV